MNWNLTRENNHDEHLLQERIVTLLRRHWCIPLDTDVMDGIKYAPNDMARIKYINIHKARGYVNGQPDLVVLLPSGRVLLVELKTKSGRLSDAQKVFQSAVENMSHEYVVWRSVEDAEKWFRQDKGDNVQTNGSGGGSPLTLKLPPQDKRINNGSVACSPAHKDTSAF